MDAEASRVRGDLLSTQNGVDRTYGRMSTSTGRLGGRPRACTIRCYYLLLSPPVREDRLRALNSLLYSWSIPDTWHRRGSNQHVMARDRRWIGREVSHGQSARSVASDGSSIIPGFSHIYEATAKAFIHMIGLRVEVHADEPTSMTPGTSSYTGSSSL